MNSHILPKGFFEPNIIHRTQFFVQKFNFVIKDDRIQLSNIHFHISAVYETEFALVFQTNKCVTVTELDFVFDNKTVRELLKEILTINSLVSSLYNYF